MHSADTSGSLARTLSVLAGIDPVSWPRKQAIPIGIAALFGFTGIAAAAAGIARILFFIFLVLLFVALVLGLSGDGT